MYKSYQMDTKRLEQPEIFRSCYEEVSKERRQKVDSFRRMEDKRLSLAAGVLFNHSLKEYGLSGDKVRLAEGENGKPYLLDYPDIYFNISHSEQKVLVVFSDVEIGCDIEYAAALQGLGLAEKFFVNQNMHIFYSRKKKNRQRRFTVSGL